MALERASTQNYRLGTALLTYGKIAPPEQVYDRLAKVTPEEVRKVASQVLNRRTLCLAMVGPGATTESLNNLLQKRC
jgi:predicted Zn-dependent peptidase